MLVVFFLSIIGMIPIGSFAEWKLHKDVMHNKRFTRPFERHTVVHHGERAPGRFFDKDEVYASMIPLFLALFIPLGCGVGVWVNPGMGWGIAMGSIGYVVWYELLHFNIHRPREGSWFQRTKIFSWHSEYHRVHHEKHGRNLNVVCPIADWWRGTMYTGHIDPEPSAVGAQVGLTGPASVGLRWDFWRNFHPWRG